MVALPTNPLSTIYERDGKVLRLHLHPGQTRAWDSTRRFVFVIAGTQSGKTSFGPWWLHREIQRMNGGDYLAVTATYDLFKLKMLPEMLTVFEELLHIGRYWAGDQVIELRDPQTGRYLAKRSRDPMWGRIILRSASSPGGLESATARAAWLDECGQDEFGLGAWQAVKRRLSLFRGRVLGTTTPYNLGWIKQHIYDPWRKGAADIDVIQFASVVNPAFSFAEFNERRADTVAWLFRMMYMGLFERPAGLIYDFIDEYEENGGHKIRPFNIPPHWPRWVGIDPGGVHTASVWIAEDPTKAAPIYYVYRTELDGRKSTPELVAHHRKLAAQGSERVQGWAIGNQSEIQQRADWLAAGMTRIREPLITDVEAGIDRVTQLLRQFRLYVFDDCHGILDEIATYSRELDADGNTTDKIKNKAAYHHLDALRYIVPIMERKRSSPL